MSVLDIFKLENKTALVTGAGRGIGRVFAIALAEAGANVVVSDLDERSGYHVCQEIKALGRETSFFKANVTKTKEVECMVAHASNKFGGLDIAVNGAALYSEDWLSAMDNGLNSVCFCCMAEAEVMKKKKKGKIVNIASISGISCNVGTPYCVAKAGVIMLTRCLAKDWGGYNINVNSISPTYTLSTARRFDDEEIKTEDKVDDTNGLVSKTGRYGRRASVSSI